MLRTSKPENSEVYSHQRLVIIITVCCLLWRLSSFWLFFLLHWIMLFCNICCLLLLLFLQFKRFSIFHLFVLIRFDHFFHFIHWTVQCWFSWFGCGNFLLSFNLIRLCLPVTCSIMQSVKNYKTFLEKEDIISSTAMSKTIVRVCWITVA